jgi:hypothetical protein
VGFKCKEEAEADEHGIQDLDEGSNELIILLF